MDILGKYCQHLSRVATKVREWRMERNILGILKGITPLLEDHANFTAPILRRQIVRRLRVIYYKVLCHAENVVSVVTLI